MFYYVFKKICCRTGEHLEHYKVSIPSATEKDFYKSVSSLNAFNNNRKRRLDKTNDVWYHGCHSQDYELSLTKKESKELVPVSSIWEFYKVIGYDCKKKRIVN